MTGRSDDDHHVHVPPARRMNAREILGPVVLASIVSGIFMVGGNYMTYKGAESAADLAADASIIRSGYDRMKELERQVSSMQSQIIKQNAEIVNLKVQLNRKVSVHSMMEKLVNSIPFPAWVKRVEFNSETGDTQFRMSTINTQYEYYFGVSKYRYEGQLDSDIHPDAIAAEFKRADDRVLSMRSARTTNEKFLKNPSIPESTSNPMVTRKVTKMFLQFEGHDPLIFGIIWPPNDQQ